MRTNFLVAGLVVSALSLVPAAVVRADNDLGSTMKQMSRAMKALGHDTADLTNNTAALADVTTLEKASLAAKEMTPPLVEKMTGDEKAKSLAAYRKTIGDLIKAEVTLEQAIIDKSANDVKNDMAAIKAIEQKGHKEFRKKM